MRIVVVGTGTNIGKTHLGVALVHALAGQGKSVCGIKPIESGVPANGVGVDAAALAEVSTFEVKPQLYALSDPVSPHLAARRAGVTIEVGCVVDWVNEHAAAHWILIETAGGLLSPLGPGITNLDLSNAVMPDLWILVGVDRLGVLHEIGACQLALKNQSARQARVMVVLQSPETPDDSTGSNAEELVTLGIANVAFTMPRAEPASSQCQRVATQILESIAR